MRKLPFYRQVDSMDCGPTCLRMIAAHHGKIYSSAKLKKICFYGKTGTSLQRISEGADKIGFKTLVVNIPFQNLKEQAPLPCVAHWKKQHFVVIYEITKRHVIVGDPAFGILKYKHPEFLEQWVPGREDDDQPGVVLLLEPTSAFLEGKEERQTAWTLWKTLDYLRPYRKLVTQLLLGMLLGSLLQLFLPFITQAIVDKGITTHDLSFVKLMIIGQVVLLVGRLILELTQGQIVLYVGSRIGIFILAEFLAKLMKLPISFFQQRTTADILQRVADNGKIQTFLTSTTVSAIFSAFNLVIYGAVLLLYDLTLFSVFVIGNLVHVAWILIFTKKRRELNFKMFDRSSKNQNILIQIINGIQEIKLANSETTKQWEWERSRANTYNLEVRTLKLNQVQLIGSFLVNESRNILITYLTVRSVMGGEMSFGMMLSVQFIMGQLTVPISTLIAITQTIQDVKISAERLGEIHQLEEEEKNVVDPLTPGPQGDIVLNDVSFGFQGESGPMVLQNITLNIPRSKVTAIVGASGSGKTTLLKLLLKLYEPLKGDIVIGNVNFKTMNNRTWRDQCAAVLQEGFIFSNTIRENISMNDEVADQHRLELACQTANIHEFIHSLPLKYETKIGEEGIDLSQGQKQRILIARAIYKDPQVLIFDEATNSLDVNNEKIIVENLQNYFKERTVIVVAHRLSTIMNADKIVVLNNGKVREEGNHFDLLEQEGYYLNLIRNQLQLSR
jgi:ATP-binding cassette subfamily B protein